MMAFALQEAVGRPRSRARSGYQRRCRVAIRTAEWTVQAGRPVTNEITMSKDELIIQLIKVALGILIGGYFLWWSLEVLQRLPPPH